MRRQLPRVVLTASTVLLALLVSGCISIKTQDASQTRNTPGVVNLGGSVCISDYDFNHYTTCQASNVVEQDNRSTGGFGDGDDGSGQQSGQLLVAFRVPDGAVAPASFKSDDLAHTFDQNPSYSDQMNARFTPVPGEHWVGYISGLVSVTPPDSRTLAYHAEFGLPPGADGGPSASPFKWRQAVGFRSLSDPSQTASPVTCDSGIIFCADSPTNTPPAFPPDLSRVVSDFGVLGGSHATAGQGGTATVSFPVKYADANGLGAKDLSLTASTTLPGGTVQPGATSIHMAPNSTSTMNVTVAVPAAAPLGDYKVTLQAANGSPATTRSNTGTITVADQVAPAIRISTPPQGATFTFGQKVTADFGCTDQTNASGVRSCAGPVPLGANIDTGSLGAKAFTVTSSDNAGNASAQTNNYTVKPRRRPNVTFSFVFDGRTSKSLRLTVLLLKHIPKGSKVTVTCKAPKGKRCPVRKRFVKGKASGTVKLKKFVPKTYVSGTLLSGRVVKKGTVTAVATLTVRRNDIPSLKTLCIPPGRKKPQKSC